MNWLSKFTLDFLKGLLLIATLLIAHLSSSLVNADFTPTIQDTDYPVPSARVFFVSTTGDDLNPGTEASPLRTIQKAANLIPTGIERYTIILRAGIYREGLADDSLVNKTVTIQPYPHEQAWIKGSLVVSTWVQDGLTWRSDNWTYELNHSAVNSNTLGTADQVAGWPDMVFVNGSPLIQVSSKDQVIAGKFFADYQNNQLFIGDDPTGKEVESSAIKRFIYWVCCSGEVQIRGLGFAHFGTHSSEYGVLKFNGGNSLFENNTMVWNAGNGIFVEGDNWIIRGNTFAYNGMKGVNGYRVNNLLFEQNLVKANNQNGFNPEWDASGMKVTESSDNTWRDNIVEDNLANGLWCDISCYNFKITGNTFRNNQLFGLQYEISAKAIIASNIFANNVKGIRVGAGSEDIDLYNNTFSKNGLNIEVIDDNRINHDRTTLNKGITWVSKDTVSKNNIFSNNNGSQDVFLFVRDYNSNPLKNADDILTVSDYNLYNRSSSLIPLNLVEWWRGTQKLTFINLPAFQQATGKEANGIELLDQLTDPLFVDEPNGNYNLKADSVAKSKGEPLPQPIADAIGVIPNIPVDLGALVWGGVPLIADGTSPQITITSPLNNAIIEKRVATNITADVTDNVSVTKVEFYVDNQLICTDTEAPYSCNWINKGRTLTQTILVNASDPSFNTSSEKITVKVQ